MTKIINFNDLATPAKIALMIGVKGAEVRHEMAEGTVQNFIDNAKLVQDLGMSPDPVKEMEAYITLVSRGFPTIPEADIRLWTIPQTMAVTEMIQTLGGETVTDDAAEVAKAKAGNDQPAA